MQFQVSRDCVCFKKSLVLAIKVSNPMLTVNKSFPFLFFGGSDGSGSLCHLSTFGLEVCRALREAFPSTTDALTLTTTNSPHPHSLPSEASEKTCEKKNGNSERLLPSAQPRLPPAMAAPLSESDKKKTYMDSGHEQF